jgi:hypothetical protein
MVDRAPLRGCGLFPLAGNPVDEGNHPPRFRRLVIGFALFEDWDEGRSFTLYFCAPGIQVVGCMVTDEEPRQECVCVQQVVCGGARARERLIEIDLRPRELPDFHHGFAEVRQ